jgi:oxygen-dependent protoporphyrinogen oxidase
VAPAAAAEISGVDYASVVTVTLAYSGPLTGMSGSGFLVPAVERRLTKAVTFLSAKWSHLAGELTLVRGSVGRYGEEHDVQRDDGDLVAAVHADLVAAIGIERPPVLSRVSRWGGGLPQYATGHLDRVRRARAALPAGVVVCGAAYDGVGIPACVRSGQVAAAVLREWSGDRTSRPETEGA